MRHFLAAHLPASPPLSIPRLAGGVSEAPAPALLIPPACRTHLLAASLVRAQTTAVALPAVTDRADRNLTVASGTDEQPVIRTRASPRLPRGLDGDQDRGDTGGQSAVVTPRFGGPRGD
jgi:hypothetical protein